MKHHVFTVSMIFRLNHKNFSGWLNHVKFHLYIYIYIIFISSQFNSYIYIYPLYIYIPIYVEVCNSGSSSLSPRNWSFEGYTPFPDLHIYIYNTIRIHIIRYIIYIYIHITRKKKHRTVIHHRRTFRSQTPDNMIIWTDGKAEGEESEKRRTEERRSEKRKRQKKENAGARKGRKVAKHCVFRMICGSRGSKSRLAKAGARWEMKSCTPGWREAHFGSQNVQNTPFSDHFWKLRCRKSARCSGAKHMWKSKCTKHLMFGRLLEVEMSKKCTPLHCTTLHYTTQSDTNYNYNYNYTTLHYTTANYTTLTTTTATNTATTTATTTAT